MKKHVAVIGGGVIGLSTAYALIKDGHQVTIIEAKDKVGSQTSFANGGQLSYRYVAPLADAGVPIQALQWLGKSHSPLNFKLNISPFQWAWLLKGDGTWVRAEVDEGQKPHNAQRILLSTIT